MSGTIPLSLSQRLDNISFLPLAGGLLYFIEAGTTSTPQNAFQDSALTLPLPNPLTLDEGGNIPQLFFADGQIKIRLTNAAGVIQLAVDNIQVVGASSGGGGGGTVDPTTILQTGDIKAVYGTGVVTGFVRLNGRTIGSASSGASERANADTQALFQYLWGADPNLVVSTGRGASANADWVANKQLALPDFRSRALAGLGDMGNADNALFAGVTFTSGNSTTLGSLLGATRRTLLTANLPPYTPAGTITTAQIPVTAAPPSASGSGISSANTVPFSFVNAPASTFTGTAQGGTSAPFDAVSPYGLVTIYAKL